MANVADYTRHRAVAAAAVQYRSDPGRADDEVVGEQREGDGGDGNEREFGGPVDRNLGDGHLEPDDDRQVHEVEPVGRIGEVANPRARPRAEFPEGANGQKDERPHRQRIAQDVGSVQCVVVRMAEIHLEPARILDGGDADHRKNPTMHRQARERRDQVALPAQQPAEKEAAAVDGENGHVGLQRLVRRIHAPVAHEPQRYRGRNRKRQQRKRGSRQPRDEGVGTSDQCVTPRTGRLYRSAEEERQGGDQRQIIEKPEMSAGENSLRQSAEALAAAADSRPETVVSMQTGRSHDPARHEQRPQNEPAHDERHDDPERARTHKFTGAFAVEGHVAEKAGDQEEGYHAEGVAHGDKHPDQRAGGNILDRPADKGRHERHAGVKQDAEQQRERPGRIEIVEAGTFGAGRNEGGGIHGGPVEK